MENWKKRSLYDLARWVLVSSKEYYVCKLMKSLYGLKHSPRPLYMDLTIVGVHMIVGYIKTRLLAVR